MIVAVHRLISPPSSTSSSRLSTAGTRGERPSPSAIGSQLSKWPFYLDSLLEKAFLPQTDSQPPIWKQQGRLWLVTLKSESVQSARNWQQSLDAALRDSDRQLLAYEWAFEVGESGSSNHHYHVLLWFRRKVRGRSTSWQAILGTTSWWTLIPIKDLALTREYIRKQQNSTTPESNNSQDHQKILPTVDIVGKLPVKRPDRWLVSAGEWPTNGVSGDHTVRTRSSEISSDQPAAKKNRKQLVASALELNDAEGDVCKYFGKVDVALASDKYNQCMPYAQFVLDERGLAAMAAIREVEGANPDDRHAQSNVGREQFTSAESQRLQHAWWNAVRRNRVLWVSSPTRYGKSSWVRAHIPWAHAIKKIEDLEKFDFSKHTVIWCESFQWKNTNIEDCKALLNSVRVERHFKVRCKHVHFKEGVLYGIIVTSTRSPAKYFGVKHPDEVDAILARIDHIELGHPLFDTLPDRLQTPTGISAQDPNRGSENLRA